MCNYMDESQKKYAKQQQPKTKGHILYDFIQGLSRAGTCTETESRLGLHEAGGVVRCGE